MKHNYDIPIPDYITITEINGGLLVQDTRTNLAGKIRDIKRLDKKQINWQLERFLHEFDNKHNKSLPIEERKGTNTPTDFTCPHCFNKETTKIIKTPKIGTYRAGMYYARKTYVNVSLQNVYECSVCKNQFTEEELNQAISKVDKSNRHEILFQQLQDKIITDNEYQDKRFELEIGMTKAEYKLKLK